MTPLQLHNEIQTNCEASRTGYLILLNLLLKPFQQGKKPSYCSCQNTLVNDALLQLIKKKQKKYGKYKKVHRCYYVTHDLQTQAVWMMILKETTLRGTFMLVDH